VTPRKDKAEVQKRDNPETAQETPFQRFERTLRHIVSVPKTEIDRREAEWRKQRKEKTS